MIQIWFRIIKIIPNSRTIGCKTSVKWYLYIWTWKLIWDIIQDKIYLFPIFTLNSFVWGIGFLQWRNKHLGGGNGTVILRHLWLWNFLSEFITNIDTKSRKCIIKVFIPEIKCVVEWCNKKNYIMLHTGFAVTDETKPQL